MMLEDEFGDIIRKARVGQGYSVEHVSSQTSVPVARLLGFESYELKPQREEVEEISLVLSLGASKLWDIAIDAYAPRPEPWRVETRATVHVIPADVGGYFENCYVVSCPETSRTVIFDPGGNTDTIAGLVAENGLVVEAVAITHGHADHTAGVNDLTRKIAVHDFFMHSSDKSALKDFVVNEVDEGDEFRVGTLAVSVIHTPGHTAGSLCYKIGRLCVVGDTLFAGSVGKAMAGGGSYQTLLASVRSKLLSLDEATALLPGHGPAMTVGEEIAHNPFF